MGRILTIATAGLKADQYNDIEHISYPRVDYLELRQLIGTDVLDYGAYESSRAGNLLRNLETRLRSDLFLTMLGLIRSRQYDLVFTMSERAGIPFACLNSITSSRRPFITMFQCWSPRQEAVINRLNLFTKMDGIAVHCENMKRLFIKLGAQPERIRVLPYSIDDQFFSPIAGVDQQSDLIVSVGEVRSRNYPALFEAVRGLPVKVVAAASGAWYAREKVPDLGISIPENVSVVKRITQAELRQYYARAQFVVLPIYDVPYSAGATAALESGCMARAVIAFHSQGIEDYIIDGVTGILVEPGNVGAMRAAIEDLVANPQKARQLGANARQRIEQELNLNRYVSDLGQFISDFYKE